MKLLYVLLIIFVIFSGCKKEQKNTAAEENKIDSATARQKDAQTKSDPQNASNRDGQNNLPGLVNIEYGISKLPLSLKDYDGKIVAMAKWEDNLGANVLFITETDEKGGENRHKELYGYHYLINENENKLLWKINDFIKDCPVDITLKYIDKSITITDLDKNGIGESLFLYRMACKGDVSPDDMKLIMHEGETKYAIRGTMRLVISGEKPYGGEMKIDASFDKAPVEFADFAKEQWNKFVNEKIN